MMAELKLEDCINDVCPCSGKIVSPKALMRYHGQVVGFASPADRDRFLAAFIALEAAMPGAGRQVAA